jgi:hypothetical protein
LCLLFLSQLQKADLDADLKCFRLNQWQFDEARLSESSLPKEKDLLRLIDESADAYLAGTATR